MKHEFMSAVVLWGGFKTASEENKVTQNILMGNIRMGTTTQCFFFPFSSTTCHIWSYLHFEIVQVSLDLSARLDFNMDKHAPISHANPHFYWGLVTIIQMYTTFHLVTEVDNGKNMLGHRWCVGIRFKNTTLKVSMHSYRCSSVEVIVITKIIIITKSKNTEAAGKCSLQVFYLHLSSFFWDIAAVLMLQLLSVQGWAHYVV